MKNNTLSRKTQFRSARLSSFLVLALLLMSGVLVMIPEEGSAAWDDGLHVKLVWDDAPFGKILTLVTYNGELYAGGRLGQDKIYKSDDGETWTEAFPNKTSDEWRSSGVFNGSLYFGSVEDKGSTWSATIWRSTDGSSLSKVHEEEDSAKIIPLRFRVLDNALFVGINSGKAMILKSEDGENWEEVFSTEDYNGFFDFTEYKGAFYATAGGEYDGGAVFKSDDGETWEKVIGWDEGTERWSDSGRDILVFNDELYVSVNGDRDSKWIKVFKSSDGEEFEEVWYYGKDYTSSPALSIYRGRLYLTFSGDKDKSVGGEIRVLDAGEFKLLKAGKGGSEHHFLGLARFNKALYVGGGSGTGGDTDGFVYRIMDDGLEIELAWDDAPFERIITSEVYDDELYMAGKKGQEKIYKSADGDNWEAAFSQKTTYEWRSSFVFKDALYFGSCEDTGSTWTATIWRSTDGSSLQKIYENEDDDKIIPTRFGMFNDTLFVGINNPNNAMILRSEDGTNWEEAYTTTDYDTFGVCFIMKH